MDEGKKPETRLGKGLGALLGEYLEEVDRPVGAEREMELDRISPNPFQPRREFAEAAIEDLAASIRENGLIQPLVVRPRGEEGWELVAGERRWRALRLLGWERAPAIVRELRDEQMLVLALVENLQREDLSPLEEAAGYRQLVEEFGLTQQEVGERVGRDRSTVANTLRLLALPPEVRELVAGGTLSAGHARAILGLADPPAQVRLAREVVDRGLTVRQTERRVRRLRAEEDDEVASEPVPDRSPDPVARRAETLLERQLGTEVRVRPGEDGARGEITILFHDADDFERLLQLLAGEAAGELLEEA